MKGKISFISSLLSRSSSKADIRESIPTEIAPPIPAAKAVEEKIEKIEESKSQKPPVARKPSTQRNNERITRSTTLAKRLSTSFRRPSSPSASHVPLPSASSRQFREAALRERGLIPSKDMSTLEREQDERISPVFPSPESLGNGLSEADRIKQEWEAKSKDTADHEKSSSPALESADQLITDEPAKLPKLELATVQEVTTPLPSPAEQPIPSPTPPTLRKSSSRTNLVAAKPPPLIDLPPTPTDPETIPLPPSPFPDTSSIRSVELELSPRIIPLPSSPSPPSSPRTAEDQESENIAEPETAAAYSSFETPRPKLTLSTAPPASSPIASPNLNSAYECSEDGALAPPSARSRSRTRAVPFMGSSESDESESIRVPSLATSSQITLESAFSQASHKTKPMPLMKTWTNEPKVPVIVESPIEGHLIEDHGLINTIPEDEFSDPPSPLPRRGRLQTTAADTKGRRKSFFGKRNTSDDPQGPKVGSFASFRRSVVGTLSRGGHSPSAKLTSFDISNLPPSPIVPASFQSTGSRRSNESPPRGRTNARTINAVPRQALSPTIHSRGSIWTEANTIQDDETRRMTEMAFLG
jgi:hypothetical protein